MPVTINAVNYVEHAVSSLQGASQVVPSTVASVAPKVIPQVQSPYVGRLRMIPVDLHAPKSVGKPVSWK
ncbi:uncharacterized protein GLRG_00362 [Colletotrichum graminicola M1.001]|uniref:Uncharacterized protein n=1 Tax=Colletotrichum graminicola (strain M1.001 / M2 / FGSC 10212) TaxID=645133 RepID=E3Q2B7_COLGM|nr:uncharacterized protein GLRG_00362 [Colletotrichum graminicola M1.001]EFQ25218.1 hypothetical protein GLRG_00362 [Colletotrichum graminicola M1.001]